MKSFRLSRATALLAGLLLVPTMAQAAPHFSVPAIPAGVMITGYGTGLNEEGRYFIERGSAILASTPSILADVNGRSLYTYAKDEAGRSTCIGECLAAWKPFAAPRKAAAFGDWNVIPREDGSKQWAYKGKPLYTYTGDTLIGEVKGEKVENGAWAATKFNPLPQINLPPNIAVAEVSDALGVALVTTAGQTIYAFDGNVKDDGTLLACRPEAPCTNPWKPLIGAGLDAEALGDFSLVKRPDGDRQWAYKGFPLYVFSGDSKAGQIKGRDVDPRRAPALVVHYPVPKGVELQDTLANGLNFATRDGQSLYRQHIYWYNGDGHDFARYHAYYPQSARAVSTRGCTAECLDKWTPFLAPDGAEPLGHWSVLTRDDGRRQWAYKESALYTYVDDKKAGDLLGVNTWMISVTDDALGLESWFARLNVAESAMMSNMVWVGAFP